MLPLASVRWGARDLLDLLKLPEHSPAPEPSGSPEDQLYREAEALGVQVLDLRGMPRNIHYPPREGWGWFRDKMPKKNVPIRSAAKGRRKWENVTGIMLHTTAVDMAAKRFLGVPVHNGIAEDATIVLCHPHDVKVWHGNAANRFTAGVEISGHSDCSELQAKAAQVLVRYIYNDVQDHDPHAMVMMGHIQSHPTKVRDPGAPIWQQVALPMMAELGLKEGPVLGKGHRIPARWKIIPARTEQA